MSQLRQKNKEKEGLKTFLHWTYSICVDWNSLNIEIQRVKQILDNTFYVTFCSEYKNSKNLFKSSFAIILIRLSTGSNLTIFYIINRFILPASKGTN